MIQDIRFEIVKEASSWEGTPYHHQACVKGVGVDCAQFILGVGKAVGLINENLSADYSEEWNVHNRDELLIDTLIELNFVEVEPELMLPGDVLVFTFGRVSSHLAILLDNDMMIHAKLSMDKPKVVSHPLSGEYVDPKRNTRVFKFPGVIE